MSTPWVIAFLVLWAVVVIEAMILVGLMRRGTGAIEAVEQMLSASRLGLMVGGAPAGTSLPTFEVSLPTEDEVVRSDELFGVPSVVLFVSEGCEPCSGLISQLNPPDGAADAFADTSLIVIADSVTVASELRQARTMRIFIQNDGAASRAFQNVATPQAFAVDAGGTVVSSIVPGSYKDLVQLMDTVRRGGASAVERV